MLSFLFHYLIVDVYYPVWPNIVASLIVYTYVAFKISVLTKLHRELHTRLEGFQPSEPSPSGTTEPPKLAE
jgi:hypothetical protein